MSYLQNALRRMTATVDRRIAGVTPFRATVQSVAGNLTYIKRLAADTADAEPYAKTTADTFVSGDEVMCMPVNGKPVIIGKVRR